MRAYSKVALVTGGAVRIGGAICEALAREGIHVVIHCNRSAAAADILARRLRRGGVKAWVVRQELRDQDSCEALIRNVRKLAGRLDFLVNNAAVFHKQRLAVVTWADLEEEFRVNCFVPVCLMRAFAMQTRRGKVVNLLDRRVAANDPECPVYSVSKKALAAFTTEAALALAPGIVVNAVAPGPVLPPPGKGMSYLHDRAGRIPLACKVKPADVAAGVLTMLRLESVTGQILFVDGGQHLLGSGV